MNKIIDLKSVLNIHGDINENINLKSTAEELLKTHTAVLFV